MMYQNATFKTKGIELLSPERQQRVGKTIHVGQGPSTSVVECLDEDQQVNHVV